MNISIPNDLEGRAEFRALAQRLAAAGLDANGGQDMARSVVFRLWIELANMAGVTRCVGFLPKGAAEYFFASIRSGDGQAEVAVRRAVHEALCAVDAGDFLFFLNPVDLPRYPGPGWFCPIFAPANAHLHPDHQTLARKGGAGKVVSAAQNRAAEGARLAALSVPAEVFRKADGNPMDGDQINKVTLLINTLDNLLARATRPPADYTPGLVQNALGVLQRHSPQMIRDIQLWIHTQRGLAAPHPAVPLTAEQVLAGFNELVRVVSEK